MEKRSLFKSIFGAIGRRLSLTRLQLLGGHNAIFTPWKNKPYEADVTRSAVDAIARNAAKLKAKHIRRGPDGQITNVGGNVERLLQIRPNPNMSAFDFLYKTFTTLMIDNNVFIYPRYKDGELHSLWPLNITQGEFLEDATGEIYIRFHFATGKQFVAPYSEVIHLRRHYYKSDLSGESNSPINTALEAVHTTNQGIAQAIKSSANLRGIIKYQGMLKDKDIRKNRDSFMEEYMSMNNAGGIAALDSKADYKELKTEPKILNAAQMKELRDMVYRYYGVNEAIVSSSYTESQWDSFYESIIEPLAVQLSLEFTYKLFTDRERGHGNEIIFESNRLQYASTKTKVSIVKELVPMGLLTLNESREIFNLAPVEGGNKRLVSLNYVDADKANLYQLGEEDPQDGEED